MFITLKTLQEDSFIVEIDPFDTVKCFKEKINEIKGDSYPAKHIKLMYGGKFLLDGKRVCDYQLEERKFVIIVVKQPKSPIAKGISSDVPVIEEAQIPPLIEVPEGRERRLCTEHERLVQVIVDLGFPRSEVEQALSASYFDPDQAVELLINGYSLGPSASHLIRLNARRNSLGASGSGSTSNNIRSRSPSPSRMNSDHRRMSGSYINQSAASRSRSRERLNGHELMDDEVIDGAAAAVTSLGAAQFSAAAVTASHLSSAAVSSLSTREERLQHNIRELLNVIGGFPNLSEEEYEAIERLKQLGFPVEKVIEAFFVCERNEESAANFLCTSNMD